MSLLFQARRQFLASAAERYRARVLADGGTVFSMSAVKAAYAQAALWEVDPQTTHWTSPLFGSRSYGNQLDVRYCLFGHDATPSSSAGAWTVQAGAPGKAPQHYTNKAGFQFGGLPWASLDLLAHVICQPASWQADVYPYFPLLENSADPNQYGGFLLGAEAGVMEGGYADATGISLAQATSLPPINTLATIALQVDKTLSLPARRRLWVNNVEGLTQYDSGQPTLTAYSQGSMYIGWRGLAQMYAFNGTINDVFVTNKVLPASARPWLDNQKNAY